MTPDSYKEKAEGPALLNLETSDEDAPDSRKEATGCGRLGALATRGAQVPAQPPWSLSVTDSWEDLEEDLRPHRTAQVRPGPAPPPGWALQGEDPAPSPSGPCPHRNPEEPAPSWSPSECLH